MAGRGRADASDRDAVAENQLTGRFGPLPSPESEKGKLGVYSGWAGANTIERQATRSAVSSNRVKKKVRSTNRGTHSHPSWC